MRLTWPADYPDKDALKREARSMAESCAEALLACIPREAISGIWWKGSAHKPWDSVIDYVPEVSDIDIHVLFADDSDVAWHIGAVEQGLAIQEEIERRYFGRVPKPIHLARPQIIPLNKLLRDPDYFGSPLAMITTLYGRGPEAPDYTDIARVRDIARRELLALAAPVADLPMSVLDKPGRYLWWSLRNLAWHIAPIAPKALVLVGVPPGEAWSMNRTALVGRLEWADMADMAEDYAQFYLSAWRYFLSGYADHDAGRAALASGVRVMSEAVRIAETR